MDKEKGFAPQQDDTPVDVPNEQVVTLKAEESIKDGKW